jgi:hypothetical protein
MNNTVFSRSRAGEGLGYACVVSTRLLLLTVLACTSLAGSCGRRREEYLEPVDVSRTQGQAEYPAIAVGPDGTAYLAWSESNHWTDEQGRMVGAEDIRLAVKPVNGTWSEPQKITSGDHPARSPSVVADRNGVVHLAWQEWIYSNSLGYWAILYTCRTGADTWMKPDTLSMYHCSTYPVLAADYAGDVHLYWDEKLSWDTGYTCYARKPREEAWRDFHSISIGDSMIPLDREMRVDVRGGVHIVQQCARICHLERTPGGEWEDMTRLSASWGAYPSFAIRSSGVISVVWADDDTSYRGFAYRERAKDGTWGAVVGPYRQVWKQDFWGPRSALFLRCVADSQDRLHVFWLGVGKLGYASMAGGVWAQPRVLVESIRAGVSSAIASSPDGRIFYAWASHGDDDGDVFCVEFEP